MQKHSALWTAPSSFDGARRPTRELLTIWSVRDQPEIRSIGFRREDAPRFVLARCRENTIQLPSGDQPGSKAKERASPVCRVI
ncbi:MAG TPA: hypothetical protein VED37_01935 [Ktedonobacteraceae bacterium]|nr:hypothetical protein [Ktedonobacteraceae bacterium]